MNIKKFTPPIVSLSLIIIGLVYIYVNRSDLQLLYNITFKNIFIISIIQLSFSYATGYTFKLLISLMNINLSQIETIGLSILTNFGNYLGPTRPGAALKAMYLKSSKALTYAKFSSILAANTLLAAFMTGSVGALLLYLLNKEELYTPIVLIVICIALMIGSTLPFVIRIKGIKVRGKISEFIQSALEGFDIIRTRKTKLLFICFSFLIQFVLAAFIYISVFNALGISISYLLAFVIGVFTSISNLLTITPNNIGIQETIIAYLYTISGLDFTSGLIGASLTRVLHMVLVFIFAPIFAHILLKDKDISLKKILPWRKTEL